MQRPLSSAPHGLGCKREVPSVAREQAHTLNWDQHPQILLPIVCNTAGSNVQQFLPPGPVCFYSRQNEGLSIMSVLVRSERHKKPEILGIVWGQR